MKRIVIVVGGVETLEYFAYQMGKTFEKEGYLTFYFDLKDVTESAKRLKKFNRYGETALLTYNFEGLSQEIGIYKSGKGYIWEEYLIPCYNIAVDHPYYYHKRLAKLPKEYYHISIDRKHEAYFKKFYPEYNHLGFLPLAGTMLEDDLDVEKSVGEDHSRVNANGAGMLKTALAENRMMDVIMTGNYTPLSFSEPHIHRIDEEYAAFYQGIIDELIKEPHKTLEEVAMAHCRDELGEVSNEGVRLVLHNMIFIDLYIRSYWRGEVVKTLVEAGIHVDVFGKGWEELNCDKRKMEQFLHIHPQTTSLVCLQQIKQAKVSLNVMPWFKDGAHDRVFNSILNGTVCVTDKSIYLCDELKDGEGVCYYELDKLKLLPERVLGLLNSESQRQEIIEKGLKKVNPYHTWDDRARQLINWLQ